MDLKENLNQKAQAAAQQSNELSMMNYSQVMMLPNYTHEGNHPTDNTIPINTPPSFSEAVNNPQEFSSTRNYPQSENIVPINQQDVIMNNVPQFEISIKEARDRILQLQDFIRFMMVPNVDYGFIPNCPKPTLFKAGAEKLCDVYGLTKQIEVINRIEDFNQGLFHYEVKATLTNKRTGLVEAEGIGCCNNKEKKYINQDPFSIINTILKMAKKRALVDAVLSATRTSGIFAQDLEGMSHSKIN